MNIIALISREGCQHSVLVELPCTLEHLKERVSNKAPEGLYVDEIKVSHWSISITIPLYIYTETAEAVNAMNSAISAILAVPGGELSKLVAVFEWQEKQRRGRLTWERVEELARDLPNFVHYARAYNAYDVGFTVAHKLGLLKELPDRLVNNFPYEQLGEAHMGDGAFTHYGFIGHWDKVMHDVKKAEEWVEKC